MSPLPRRPSRKKRSDPDEDPEAGGWSPHIKLQFPVGAGRMIEGHVLSISGDSIVATFEPGPELALPLGKRLKVTLIGSGPRTSHDARVMQRSDGDDRIDYTFRAAGAESFTSSSNRNRRSAFRVPVSRRSPIVVEISPYEDDEWFEPIASTIHDISRIGFGLAIPDAAEDILFALERVRVRFELPGDSQPFSIVGIVRQRRFQGMFLRYGIEFDQRRTEGWGQIEERLNRFVMRRQVDVIRRTHRWKPAG